MNTSRGAFGVFRRAGRRLRANDTEKVVPATDRGLGRVRVGLLDRVISDSAHWLLFGPIEPLDADQIAAAIDTLSGGDPVNRIGLLPNSASQWWDFDSAYGKSAVLPAPAPLRGGELTDVADILNSVIDMRLDRPLAVAQVGRDILLYFEHGIGDPYVMIDVLMASSWANFDARPVERMVSPNITSPVLSALGHIFRSTPRSAFADLALTFADAGRKVVRFTRNKFKHRDIPRGEHVAVDSETDGLRCVHVVSSPDYAERVQDYKKRRGLKISSSSLTLCWICRSLEAAGIPVSSEVGVLVDLRRYLPPNSQTYANFTSVLMLKYGPDCTEEEFGARFTSEVRSNKPLLNLACYLALGRVLPWLFRRVATSKPPIAPHSDAIVTFTDPSKMPFGEYIAWADDEPRRIAGIAQPATRSHITITILSATEGEVQVTAAFFSAQFDARMVEGALANALNTPLEH